MKGMKISHGKSGNSTPDLLRTVRAIFLSTKLMILINVSSYFPSIVFGNLKVGLSTLRLIHPAQPWTTFLFGMDFGRNNFLLLSKAKGLLCFHHDVGGEYGQAKKETHSMRLLGTLLL